MIKRFTRPRLNTQAFEIGVAEDVAIQHIETWSYADWDKTLLSKTKPTQKLMRALRDAFPGVEDRDFEVAPCAVCKFQKVAVGDLVYFADGAGCGEVIVHVEVRGHAHTLISKLLPEPDGDDVSWSCFRAPDASDVVVADTGDVECPVVYTRDGHRVLVLTPAERLASCKLA